MKDYGAFDIVGNSGGITTSYGNYGYFIIDTISLLLLTGCIIYTKKSN